MKTFREFILECELVEGKVEWDNPKRPQVKDIDTSNRIRIL